MKMRGKNILPLPYLYIKTEAAARRRQRIGKSRLDYRATENNKLVELPMKTQWSPMTSKQEVTNFIRKVNGFTEHTFHNREINRVTQKQKPKQVTLKVSDNIIQRKIGIATSQAEETELPRRSDTYSHTKYATKQQQSQQQVST